MKTNNTMCLIIFLLSSVFILNLNAQIGVPPNPNAGSANVDGDVSEWDLSTSGLDFFANMYQAWKDDGSKPVLTYLYLRYDCNTGTMYALVYQKDDTVPLVRSGGDHWIAIPTQNDKVVDESDGDDGTPPDFAYVDIDYGTTTNSARGFEASFLYGQGTTKITAHTNVDFGGTSTSGTGGKEIDLVIDCNVLPVELSSFSVILKNDLAQLEWETATEINNYGFEVQRSSEELEWAKVGFVKGAGNSNSPKYYSFTDQSVTTSGNYSYRLKQIDIDGQYEYSDVVNINLNVNEIIYKLNQNYPNPFNPTTTISYTLPEETFVNIVVYNVFGEEVARVVEETKEIGTHSIVFNAEDLATGVYYYKIETENYVATKKLMILK